MREPEWQEQPVQKRREPIVRLASLDEFEGLKGPAMQTEPVVSAEDDQPPAPDGMDEPQGLNLDQVMTLTLTSDPAIRAGIEEVAQSRADLLTSSLKPNPELEASQQMLPFGRMFEADVREGGPPQLDVILSYPIDWYVFGKRAAAMLASTRGVYAAHAEYADLIRLRVTDAAVAYFDVLEAEALLDLARQDVQNLERVLEITQLAVDNGARPTIELRRVQLDLLASRQGLREAEAEAAAARADLRALLGLSQGDAGFRISGSLDAPLLSEPLEPDQAFEVARENRPDLQALRWRVSEARAEWDVERREAYPEIAPQAGYTHQFQRRAIGQPNASSWGVGLVMSIPIHDRNQGNRAKAAAVIRQSEQEYRLGLVETRAEIDAIWAELSAARENLLAVGPAQLELAEQVRDSINEAYEAGGRPLLDALDAQRDYRETFRVYIESRANYWRAVYRYAAALGAHKTL